MAILATVFGLLGRFAGRLLTTALGWASTLLFGRVPESKQILLALITLGSLFWVAMLAGVIVPSVGTFLLAAVPAPDFIDENWIRLAMLIGAIITPLVIGIGGLFVVDATRRPKEPKAIAEQVLRGYPLALFMAGILVFLALVAVGRKARSLAKRWSDAHVPIVVKPGGYDRMVDDLEGSLDDAGLAVERRPAPAVLSLPGRLVGAVAGSAVRSLVPDKLILLNGPDLEVGLYPTDISISGPEATVARARAAIASRLATTAAYLTTSAEGQAVEDRLERLAARPPLTVATPDLAPEVAGELAAIDEILAGLKITYDEWEVLYRIRLQVERDIRAGHRPGEKFPGDQRLPEPLPPRPLPSWAPAAGFASLVLICLDVFLAIADRVRPANPRSGRRR